MRVLARVIQQFLRKGKKHMSMPSHRETAMRWWLLLIISLFLAGYGLFHIPTGFLAYRFGLRNTLLAGLLLVSLGGIATAFAPNYGWLSEMGLS